MRKILVAMSGGVDSAVAALLLQRQGFQVYAATMRLFDENNAHADSGCCSRRDIEDARRICARLGIEHSVVPLESDFTRQVVKPFVQSYAHGLTPNPCIVCNQTVKFPLLWRHARELGCDGFATGHYARVEPEPSTGLMAIRTALDVRKDQSYFLYGLPQELLRPLLLPMGGLSKPQVREVAALAGLPVASKPDSQDICFISGGDYPAYLRDHWGLSPAPGPLVDINGQVLGQHPGVIHYTIGQRKGLPVQLNQKTYVVRKDAVTATVTVGTNDDLMHTALTAGALCWGAYGEPAEPVPVKVKTRHSHSASPALLHPPRDGIVHVSLNPPVRAVTPGQAVVFYAGDTVMGGGTILTAE